MKITCSLKSVRGDIMLEALVSVAVLGFTVVGISSASRIMFNEQREALVQELVLNQAKNQVFNYDAQGFDECSKILVPLAGASQSGDAANTTLEVECTPPTSAAMVGNVPVSDVDLPRSAKVNSSDLGYELELGLRLKEREAMIAGGQ